MAMRSKTVMRLTLVATLLLAQAGAARAACGIGSHIWEGRSGWAPWLAASITNWFTFKGISTTFEIAGCTEKNNLLKKLFAYTDGNLDHLAVEMARGQGEHLDVFAALLEVPEGDRPHFGRLVQENLGSILPHDRVTTEELIGTVAGLMAADETLTRHAGR
jgi:hypothetical protein